MRARARFRIMVEVDSNMTRDDVNQNALAMVRGFTTQWVPVLIATEQLVPSEQILFEQRKK